MLRTILTIITITIFTSAQVFVIPKQIDIEGLIPGVSTKQDFEKTRNVPNRTNMIGGYEMICVASYIDASLSDLFCTFGKFRKTQYFNGTAYRALKIEFTRKFGAPHITNTVVKNWDGKTFDQQVAVWKDEKGNELTLKKRFFKVETTGLLLLKSSKRLALDAQEEEATKKMLSERRAKMKMLDYELWH